MVDTSAPLSETRVANMAIDVLDDFPINDLNDPGPVGKFMARNFGPTRDEILHAFPWPFARKYAWLPADTDAPPFGWDYSYTFPADCIKPLPPRKEGKWNGSLIVHEVVADRKIYTNHAAPLPVIYIKREANPSKWSPLFARVLAMQLAVYGSQNITGKGSYTQKAMTMLSAAWENARLAESLTAGTPEPQNRHAIIDVRGVGFSS